MTSEKQLLVTAGAVACALILSGVVEAHGGPHQVGAHIGLQLRAQLIHAVAIAICE
jgi:hypothetical protein